MTQTDEIRVALLQGIRPYPLSRDKKYNRGLVYQIYNKMVANGELDPGGGVVIPDDTGETEDDDDGTFKEVPVNAPFQPRGGGGNGNSKGTINMKRSAASAAGKSVNVVDFTGSGGLPLDAVNAARAALGIALVPSILRMPMPELLYTAMAVSISEFGWQAMQPQDFIDTVLYEWLDIRGIITRPIARKSELQDLVDKANTIDENSPALKRYITDHNLIPFEQVQEMVNNAVANAIKQDGKDDGNGDGHNGNGHNGNGGNGGTEKHVDVPTATIEPSQPEPGEIREAIEIKVTDSSPTETLTPPTVQVPEVVVPPDAVKSEEFVEQYGDMTVGEMLESIMNGAKSEKEEDKTDDSTGSSKLTGEQNQPGPEGGIETDGPDGTNESRGDFSGQGGNGGPTV